MLRHWGDTLNGVLKKSRYPQEEGCPRNSATHAQTAYLHRNEVGGSRFLAASCHPRTDTVSVDSNALYTEGPYARASVHTSCAP